MEPVDILTERLKAMAGEFIEHLPLIGLGVLVLIVTWVVSKVVDSILETVLRKGRMRKTLASAYRKMTSILIWLVGIVVAAGVVFPSITPAKMLTALGLGSVAVGFAFKDIFENFIAGVLILMREPFRLDDFIECDGQEGFVEEITIRDTRIRQVDGQAIVIPNAQLFKNPVTVRTYQEKRRVTVICGVAYGEDVDACRQVIHDAVAGLETVDENHDVEIFAQEFAASSINFEVTWWTGSRPLEVRQSRDKVVAAVKRALDDAGIEIPFPYRTLTFKEALPIQQRQADEAEVEADS